MDPNLLLTAQRLQLAPQLARSEPAGGVHYVKNIPARTYLAVTASQWTILQLFETAQTVPQVVETVIEKRICLPLGELYELILKAERARILLSPEERIETVRAVNWRVSVRPKVFRHLLFGLIIVGLTATAALRPRWPDSWQTGVLSLAALGVAWVGGIGLAACLLRGGQGELYRSRWGGLSFGDAVMLPPAEAAAVRLAPLAFLAIVTGWLTWWRPELSLFPLLGLLSTLRPALHGRIGNILRDRAARRLSDAEQAFIFPPNRTPRQRWRIVTFYFRQRSTWQEMAYGIMWTLVLAHFFGAMAGMLPWTLTFWATQGLVLVAGAMVSLAGLAVLYFVVECGLYGWRQGAVQGRAGRLALRRWLRSGSWPADAGEMHQLLLRSNLLRQLPAVDQTALAHAMRLRKAGPWRTLINFGEPVRHVSMIISGKVGVYRDTPMGRRKLIQVLGEDDLVGLHGMSDAQHPRALFRSLTPLVVAQIDWEQIERHLMGRVNRATINQLVHQEPFLSRIRLCRNWHPQAIRHFSELSTVRDVSEGEVILQEGTYNQFFFVMLEGEAVVTAKGVEVGRLTGGDFFGEIGLLQNSNVVAEVSARAGVRVFCIHRREFLRFVANNFSVALELERVSSQRLGRPIFPLTRGDFKTL